MKSIMKFSALALVLTAVLLSCTSSSNQAKKQLSKTYTIEIKQMKFVPDNIIINAGDKVRFVNKDIFEHDVTEEKSKKWNSSALKQNESWTMIVEESSDYFCSLHVVMKGKIVVKP